MSSFEDSEANETLQPGSSRSWYRTLAAMLGVLVGVAIGAWLAMPFISAALVTDEDVRVEVRGTLAALQQEMEMARLAGDATYVLPYENNPHVTESGITVTICMGPGNSNYTMTGFGIKGEYWNASSALPGSITGPEANPVCSLN